MEQKDAHFPLSNSRPGVLWKYLPWTWRDGIAETWSVWHLELLVRWTRFSLNTRPHKTEEEVHALSISLGWSEPEKPCSWSSSPLDRTTGQRNWISSSVYFVLYLWVCFSIVPLKNYELDLCSFLQQDGVLSKGQALNVGGPECRLPFPLKTRCRAADDDSVNKSICLPSKRFLSIQKAH